MNPIIRKAKNLYQKYGSENLDFLLEMLNLSLHEIPLTKHIKEAYFKDLKAVVIDPSLDHFKKRHLISHAIGHHLLHRKREANYFIDERSNFLESLKIRKMEREAELFASYFLIPAEKLNSLLKEEWFKGSSNPIAELAEEFQVPEDLIKKRLEFRELFNC